MRSVDNLVTVDQVNQSGNNNKKWKLNYHNVRMWNEELDNVDTLGKICMYQLLWK